MHIMGVWCDMAPQGAPLELYKTKHCWVEIKTDSEFLTQSDLGDTFCRAYFVIWQKRSQLRWQISPDWNPTSTWPMSRIPPIGCSRYVFARLPEGVVCRRKAGKHPNMAPVDMHCHSDYPYACSRPCSIWHPVLQPLSARSLSACVTWASQPCVLGSPACQITGLCLQHCPAHPQLFIQHILS